MLISAYNSLNLPIGLLLVSGTFNWICHTFCTSDIFFSILFLFFLLLFIFSYWMDAINQSTYLYVHWMRLFLVVVVSKRRFVYRLCTFIRICMLQSPMFQKHYWLHFMNMNVHVYEMNMPVFHFSSMYIFSFSKEKQI